MSRRIAISMRVVEASGYAETRDALSRDWSRFVERIFPGALLLPVPNLPEGAGRIVERLGPDAVILSNGGDWGTAPERDETERRLLRACLEARVPVLGVCRGLQSLNVLFGGTLEQDLSSAVGTSHVAVEHEAALSSEALVTVAGGKSLTVNSYHNQGVLLSGLAPDLRAFATAAGDVVEGLFHPELPVLAVQWHPERSNPAAGFDREIIVRLLNEGAFWRQAR